MEPKFVRTGIFLEYNGTVSFVHYENIADIRNPVEVKGEWKIVITYCKEITHEKFCRYGIVRNSKEKTTELYQKIIDMWMKY